MSISIRNLNKVYPNGNHALKDVNLEIPTGMFGLLGPNGAGKSTLLKILSKVTTPSTGTIKARGRIASLLEVGTGFHPEMTGRENIYMNGAIMGMTKAEISRKLDEIAQYLYEKETISGEEFMRILNAQPQLPAGPSADSTNQAQ